MDASRVAGRLADAFVDLGRRAGPASNRIAAIVRIVSVLGAIGGVIGAAGLAMPGFGIVRSGPLFAAALVVVGLCATVCWRWGGQLRAWSGNVETAAGRLRTFTGSLGDDWQSFLDGVSTGNPVVRLVRGANRLRSARGSLADAQALTGLVGELTGPLQPPLVGVRVATVAGGTAMIGLGPLVALVAALT